VFNTQKINYMYQNPNTWAVRIPPNPNSVIIISNAG